MATETTSAMTAHDAAAVLADVQGVEEDLTARATGITNMIWGLAAGAIFLAYAAADDLSGFSTFAWFLWAPFVAAGWLLTDRVWSNQAVVLRSRGERNPGISAAFTIGFIAVALGLVFALPLVGIEWSTHAIMLLVNGLLALVMGTVAARVWCTCGGPQTTAAGAVMFLAAIALGIAGIEEAASGLIAGLIALAAWTGSGLAIYRRG